MYLCLYNSYFTIIIIIILTAKFAWYWKFSPGPFDGTCFPIMDLPSNYTDFQKSPPFFYHSPIRQSYLINPEKWLKALLQYQNMVELDETNQLSEELFMSLCLLYVTKSHLFTTRSRRARFLVGRLRQAVRGCVRNLKSGGPWASRRRRTIGAVFQHTWYLSFFYTTKFWGLEILH